MLHSKKGWKGTIKNQSTGIVLRNHKKQQTMEKGLLLFDKTISIGTPINHSRLFNMNQGLLPKNTKPKGPFDMCV